tara:strand:+ start:333 stop:1256 length:924 start_codon:yes stop_codon:yes gene_type:complete
MENFLYFAEAVVETGGDGAPEAICVPASRFIGSDPVSSTTTDLMFSTGNRLGRMASIRVTHAAGENKNVMREILNLVNANTSKGGFANALDFETGTAVNKAIDVAKNLQHVGATAVSISQRPGTGWIKGISGGTSRFNSYGVGTISTDATAVNPQYYREINGRNVITRIYVDLTGLKAENDDGDVVGLAAGGAAYIGKYVQSSMGVVSHVRMYMREFMTVGSGTIIDDLEIRGDSDATRVEGYDLSGGNLGVTAGGQMGAGKSFESNSIALAANDYLYITAGEAPGGSGSTYTAGKLVVELHGVLSY